MLKDFTTLVHDYHNTKTLSTSELITKHQELYEDFLVSNLEHRNELMKLKEQMAIKDNEIVNLKNEKINKNDVQSHILKTDLKIEKDDLLYSYYSSLYDKLSSVNLESEIISSGNVALKTNDVKITILKSGLQLIPLVGKFFGASIEAISKIEKSNEILEQAIKFKQVLGKTTEERKNLLFQISQKITLNKQNEILNANNNEEVEFWKEQNLISKCKDFFVVNVDREIYVTDHEILGCIDALKIIYAIVYENLKGSSKEDIEEKLIEVPSRFKFTNKKKIVENKKYTEDDDRNTVNLNNVNNVNNVNIRVSNRSEQHVYKITSSEVSKSKSCSCCLRLCC